VFAKKKVNQGYVSTNQNDICEKEIFREGEDQEVNQKAVRFTHWNSGTVYSGIVDNNFMLLNERHCRVIVPGQKKPFTVKLNDLEFKDNN